MATKKLLVAKKDENQYLLRYIVPFSYDSSDDEIAAYNRTVAALKASTRWTQILDTGGQSDCYAYMKELYSMHGEAELNNTAVGSVWKFEIDGQKSPYVNILYEVSSDIKYAAHISNAGLFLTKNGIGLFWYEVEFDAEEGVELNDFVQFQNHFKELAIKEKESDISYVLSEQIKIAYADRPDICAELDAVSIEMKKQNEENKTKGISESSWQKNKRYLTLFNKFAPVTLEYITSECKRQSLRFDECEITVTEIYDIKGQKQLRVAYDMVLTKQFGIWVDKCLTDLQTRIVYYPERKGKKNTYPDKAVLYNFLAFKTDKATLETVAYHLSNGYDKKYKKPHDIKERMYSPFDNIIWYTEKEGCGIYATYTKDNKGFVVNGLVDRVKDDYFMLYMSLLQQSYTLLHMSEEIATRVSANKADVLRSNSAMTRYLEDLETRISLFIVKNVYASVSHIGHHNLFYNYVEKQLRIKEDIETLRDGLNALDEIHRRREMEEEEKRSEKMNHAFTVIAIIGVLSIPHEVQEVVDIFVSFPERWWPEILVLVASIIGAGYLGWFLYKESKHIWSSIFPFMKRFERKDDKK